MGRMIDRRTFLRLTAVSMAAAYVPKGYISMDDLWRQGPLTYTLEWGEKTYHGLAVTDVDMFTGVIELRWTPANPNDAVPPPMFLQRESNVEEALRKLGVVLDGAN